MLSRQRTTKLKLTKASDSPLKGMSAYHAFNILLAVAWFGLFSLLKLTFSFSEPWFNQPIFIGFAVISIASLVTFVFRARKIKTDLQDRRLAPKAKILSLAECYGLLLLPAFAVTIIL